jgi:hypothetical protein
MLKREKNVGASALPRFTAVKAANLDCRRAGRPETGIPVR